MSVTQLDTSLNLSLIGPRPSLCCHWLLGSTAHTFYLLSIHFHDAAQESTFVSDVFQVALFELCQYVKCSFGRKLFDGIHRSLVQVTLGQQTCQLHTYLLLMVSQLLHL